MNIHLIQGEFSSSDALELITELIHVKIKFHENKINTLSSEEDIKSRETKIKMLQNELAAVRMKLLGIKGNVTLESQITLN
ncbi:MAG: hypothetical protein CFE21_12955 [Bacteroidetes bacterium B1(2017)]|nr:MAG: hypothetical protein CFE21_12955 [Bacteroidetes bacterium B1(2017)]